MRRILVDHAKGKNRQKRGGGARPVSIDETGTVLMNPERGTDLVRLDDALKRLSEFDKRLSEVVELKFFGGFTDDETAKILGVSNVTVRRDWKTAKAWLFTELKTEN
jgi:RNA polymerase sigma factor (TIGR02999 family)